MDGREAATVSEWIATLFAGHVAKENDKLLPALTGSGGDLAALLTDMRQAQRAAQACGRDGEEIIYPNSCFPGSSPSWRWHRRLLAAWLIAGVIPGPATPQIHGLTPDRRDEETAAAVTELPSDAGPRRRRRPYPVSRRAGARPHPA